MQITPIGYSPLPLDMAKRKATEQPGGGQFGDMLSNALQDLNQMQTKADDLSAKVVLGKDVDVHDAVIATEEASLAFQYTLQVRNKLIEAYQEIMRMQV